MVTLRREARKREATKVEMVLCQHLQCFYFLAEASAEKLVWSEQQTELNWASKMAGELMTSAHQQNQNHVHALVFIPSCS